MIMKNAFSVPLITLALLFSVNVHAGDFDEGHDDPSDPCQVTLCMYGKLTGTSDSSCSASQKTFFKLLKKKKGSIKWGDTVKKRLNFLNGCPTADPADVQKIIKKFGRKMG